MDRYGHRSLQCDVKYVPKKGVYFTTFVTITFLLRWGMGIVAYLTGRGKIILYFVPVITIRQQEKKICDTFVFLTEE